MFSSRFSLHNRTPLMCCDARKLEIFRNLYFNFFFVCLLIESHHQRAIASFHFMPVACAHQRYFSFLFVFFNYNLSEPAEKKLSQIFHFCHKSTALIFHPEIVKNNFSVFFGSHNKTESRHGGLSWSVWLESCVWMLSTGSRNWGGHRTPF